MVAQSPVVPLAPRYCTCSATTDGVSELGHLMGGLMPPSPPMEALLPPWQPHSEPREEAPAKTKQSEHGEAFRQVSLCQACRADTLGYVGPQVRWCRPPHS